MDEATKQACVGQVVKICKELAQRRNDEICGVDGGGLSENWIKPPRALDGYSHEILLQYCKELKMKCDAFVLYHCDIGPKNAIVDLTEGCKVGLVDWEVTGLFLRNGLGRSFAFVGVWISTSQIAMWREWIGDSEFSFNWHKRASLKSRKHGRADSRRRR